tara:strand:+ start:23543 stop:26275 length:2733 start_codon:yes stop_codon:yes gene_type:complete
MATTKYIDIKLRTKSAETSADKLDGKMKGLGTTVDKTSNSFGVLSKVAAAVGTAIITGQITKYADAYTSLQNQVRQTTNSMEELTQRTKDLLDISNRSRAGISSTSELYTQLVLSTENLSLSTEEQLRLTETITKSFLVSGKSAAESAGSIRQLGQAFAAGVLRGDEFNSIAENAPEIMRALQRSLNLTQGELRDLAATGGITAEILVNALGEAAEVIDTKFNNSTATMAQNIEVANNNLTEFIGSSTTVQNVMGGLGGAIVTASENISTIASGAAVVASVFAAKLIPSILLSTKAAASSALAFNAEAIAKAKQSKETLQQVVADRALTAESVTKNRVLLQSIIVSKDLALQEVIRARSINAVTLANLEELKSNAARAQSAAFSSGLRLAAEERVVVANAASVASSKAIIAAEIELSAISARLTAQKAASTVATNAHAAAKTKEAAATGVLTAANTALTRSAAIATAASRALTASIAFLGGPLGIVLIAATALYTFGDSVTDLNRKVSTATPEMDAFAASIEKMSRGAKGASLANINNEMEKLRVELRETEASLDNIKVQNNGGLYDKSTIEAANYRVKIKNINDELDLLSKKQGIIIGTPDLSDGTNRGNINDAPKEATVAKQSPFSLRLSQETEALQIELALRQQVEQGYISQRDADLSAAYLIDESRRSLAFENELAKLSVDDEARVALTAQFDEVALLRKQAFEDALTGIKQSSTDDRLQIEQDAADAENQMRANVTNNAIGLLQVLGRENKAAAIAGIIISKAMALSANAVATASGATLAFAAQQIPGDPTSFARGAAAAAKTKALGAVNAGLIVATGLGQAASVFSGGSGALGATEQGTGSYNQPVQTDAAPIQTRTVDIRTDGSAFSEAVKDAALVLFNSGDDDVVLNITNAQNELIRTSGVG